MDCARARLIKGNLVSAGASRDREKKDGPPGAQSEVLLMLSPSKGRAKLSKEI
jgi:hypothetical protein